MGRVKGLVSVGKERISPSRYNIAMSPHEDDPGAHAAALHEQAIVLRAAGSFALAERACREAIAIFEVNEGPRSPNLANVLVEHARVLESLDQLSEGARAADRALHILRPLIDIGGVDRAEDAEPNLEPDVEEELVRLAIHAEATRASIIRAMGDLSQAEGGCRRAIALAEARLPPDDLLLATALNDLGVVHKFQGRYAEAEPLYRRALAIAQGAGHDGDTATLLHNLGGLAHARGDFETGEPLARRAVELRTALLGPDHPDTAADRAAWGGLLEGLGRATDAERAYTEALAVFETRLGPRSLEAAAALTALAGVQSARGALDEAERSYRRALSIREEVLDRGHFDLGLTLNNLAMLLVDRNARAEAAVLLRRAHEILAAALGPQHPHTRAVTKNIAALETPLSA